MTDTLLRDLRIGFRVLVKEKSFCALAVIVLALGICGVTTMFSVVNGVMLRGFSFPNAERLMSVQFIDPSSTNFFGFDGQVQSADFEEFIGEQKSFDMMAAYLSGSTVNVTVNGTPQRYQGVYTTPDFLRILGLSPMLGRDFRPEDNKPGAEKAVLISHRIWRRDFGGASDVIGKSVRVNGSSAVIIGVMPAGFNFPVNEDLWVPLYSEFPVRPRNDPRSNNPAVLALLKKDKSIDEATAEFTGFARRFAEAYPESNKQFNVGLVRPLIDAFTPRPLRGTLLTMLAFCVGVLLIACVNVMNMQFARATLRAKELAIRSSLGATRIALLRQMLTESLLVASIGAAIGIALAYFSIDLLTTTVRNFDNPPPAWITFDMDAVVLFVTVGATLASAVLSGLLPAWMASSARAGEVLKEGGRGNTSRTVNVLTRGLVVVQIVVTCLLLIGALLQTRSIMNQQTIDYGYDTDNLMSGRMGLMDGDYPTDEARQVFYDRLLRELRQAGDIEAVALTNRFRMVFSGNGLIEIEGKEYQDRRDRPQANFETVTAGFFDVTGQKLLEGRGLTDEDIDTRQPVAVVNAAFAQKHFGQQSAIGRRFRTVDNNNQAGPWRTIVGVVTTIRMLGPFNNPNVDDSGFYVPFYTSVFGPVRPTPFVSQFATVVVKPRGGQRADTFATPLRRHVARVDPNLPLYFVDTPKRQLEGFVAQNRVIATLFSIFGGVAVVLAAVGIYGVVSFSVNQRTQEFGVRMALGADRRRILAMVVRQAALQIALGIFLGVTLTFTIATMAAAGIQNILFGVSARDPLSYSAVVALIVVVSMIATLMPARRATRVDPMIALRAE